MKQFLILTLCALCALAAACSSIIPYKDQNLDYLQGIEKDPSAYRGQVVSFGGEVKGITEDALRLRLVLKIDAPLYYYATGKGNSLSYELLLVSFNKRGMPRMTGIQKGRHVKVLARVSSYETRKNFTGKDIVVLHLIAFAISDRTKNKDFFRPEPPDRQLYESWKKGRLFFEESAQDIIKRYPPPEPPSLPAVKTVPQKNDATQPEPAAPKGIVFDAEEPPFILPPDPAPAALTTASRPEPPNAPHAPNTEAADTTATQETKPAEEALAVSTPHTAGTESAPLLPANAPTEPAPPPAIQADETQKIPAAPQEIHPSANVAEPMGPIS